MKRKVIWDSPNFGITMLEPTAKAGKNVCAKCWAKDLCDSDDCCRKIGRL